MSILRRIPALLSLLLLGAHFLRFGHLVAVGLCLALILPLFLRSAGARRLVRGALALGALLWVWVLVQDAQVRLAEGAPWVRLVCILGAVALFTGGSSWLLRVEPGESRHRA